MITLPNRASLYRLWTHVVYEPGAAAVKALIGRSATPGLRRREFRVSEVRPWLEAADLAITSIVYYDLNVLIPPLDRFLPRLAVRMAANLEPFGPHAMGVIGTGMIVAARKGDS